MSGRQSLAHTDGCAAPGLHCQRMLFPDCCQSHPLHTLNPAVQLKASGVAAKAHFVASKSVDVCSYCISIFTVALLRELGKLPGHLQADLQRDARGAVIYFIQSGGWTLTAGA